MPYKDREKQLKYMRDWQTRKKHKIVDDVTKIIINLQRPEVEQYRRENYAKIDKWLADREAALVEESRAVVRGSRPFDVSELVMAHIKALTQARQIAQRGKELINGDIEKALQDQLTAIFDEVGEGAEDTDLYKALHGDAAAEKRFLLELAKRLDHAKTEVTTMPLPADLEKTVEEARRKVPSAHDLFEKVSLTEADREALEMRKGHMVTKMADKYKDMSDSEIRKAKQREEAEAFHKHREKVLAVLKRDAETPYTNPERLNAVKVDLIEALMTKRNLTYKEAEEAADATITEELGPPEFRECVRQKLKESPELTVEEAKDQCEASMVAKNLSQKLPSAEKLFAETQKKKGTHWLDDEKDNAVEDTYVA